MEVHKCKPGERGETRALYEEIFPEDSRAFVDYYYTEKTKDNTIYVIKEDGSICSMLHLNPYLLEINGQEMPASYIVAVATKKSYRKRGYMTALLKTAMEDMYAAGEAFTFLMPAAEEIYLPFDFRTVYTQDRHLYQEQDAVESGVLVREAEEADAAAMAQAANEALEKKYQLFVRRDPAYYTRLIHEFAADSATLMLYEKDGQISDCRIRMPVSEIPEESPKIMVRILDVRTMLMLMNLTGRMTVCFSITDPFLEGNNRCVSLAGTDFTGCLLMEGREEDSEGVLTISALTDLLFGVKTVEEACQEEGVTMSPRMKEEMGKIIPLSRIFLNEVV